jgi:transposase InsO family protein
MQPCTPSTAPCPPSHDSSPRPSALLALLCLAIVHRLHPQWLAVTIVEAARENDQSAERVSRLCSRAIPAFETTLGALTRIGRPRGGGSDREHSEQELAIVRSLLEVATTLLRHVSLRSQSVRSLLLGAWLRLASEHRSLTQERFCQSLALSPRTLRSWLAELPRTPADPALAPSPPRSPRKRPPQRRRFSYDLVLPQTQIAGDTSHLQAFGVPLKLIASQDIGGRDQALFESVTVDDQEDAELVIRCLAEAIADREGIQVVIDQGTPYMAEATRAALEELGAEHAPQREGTPTDKATIERAFRSVKTFARPLLDLTNRIADFLPTLKRPDLAKALTTLVLTALLRAYQSGARAARRADDQRAGLDPATLVRVAAEARAKARVHDQSKRLRLQSIHRDYHLDGSAADFLRAARRFPLPVIAAAERAFASQAHRDDIRNRNAYFAALLRRFHDEFLCQRMRRESERARDHQQLRHIAQLEAERQARRDDPVAALSAALEILPQYWDSKRQKLLFDGVGPGRAGARMSIERLTEIHGPQAAADIAAALLRDFAAVNADRLEPAAITAIENLIRPLLPTPPKPPATLACTKDFASTILRRNGHPQHSPPS